MARISTLSLFVLAALTLGGCAKEENKAVGYTASAPATTQAASVPASAARTISMKIGGGTFQLEIAANDHDQELGLMYRESMPLDHGMIFVFGTEQKRVFWMKNTLIPLDIVYADAAGRVVSIKHGVPMREEPTIPSDEPMKWAIELNAGVAAAVGLQVGSKLDIPPEARSPDEN